MNDLKTMKPSMHAAPMAAFSINLQNSCTCQHDAAASSSLLKATTMLVLLFLLLQLSLLAHER
jgi:hypothetical protein